MTTARSSDRAELALMVIGPERRERLVSLEAERLRPTPPKPSACPSALAEVVFREIEDVLTADVDGVLGVEPGPADPAAGGGHA